MGTVWGISVYARRNVGDDCDDDGDAIAKANPHARLA